MLGSEFQFRDKIPVAVLGATGSVGQRFVELLSSHPWFEIHTLAASESSRGKPYKEAVNWMMQSPLTEEIGELEVKGCEPNIPCSLVFSALDAAVATNIELQFAEAGYLVVSNSRNHRMRSDVPLIVPEVNSDHLDLLKEQNFSRGKIITNPNCSVIGLCLSLKPLYDNFGIESVNVVTMQALSGGGYPGVASMDILDNIIPFIRGEEEKIEKESLKILGALSGGKICPASIKITAQCNRVPVIDGHMECISVKLKKQTNKQEILQAWKSFSSESQKMLLPFAPEHPIHYLPEDNFPQPRLHRNRDKGMAVIIGRLRECPVMDYKFVILSHNTIRGAAGGSILCAEMLVRKGYVIW